LKDLYLAQPSKCNIIAISATFRQTDQDIISNLLGRCPDKVIWLEVLHQGICFDVIVSGLHSLSVTNSVTHDYKYEMDMKTIIYTNSKKQAMGATTAATESVLEHHPNTGDIMLLTGDDRIQMKVYTMHAFAKMFDNDKSIDGDSRTSSASFILPNLVVMQATKAADCGESIKLCRWSYCIGLALSLYSLVQEMGRVDRNSLEERVIIDMRFISHSLVKVQQYVRIMQKPDLGEREIQLLSMDEVLRVLVTPNEC
jgi:hypothetical protein